MRLVYDAHAVVDHFHPTDLPRTIQRMRRGGASLEPFGRRHPRQPMPSPPGFRHRAKGAALTALALTRVRTTRVQQETWRFLCHMATREGYWDAVAAREGRRTAPQEGLRVGRTLARLASRDEDARMPRTGLPPRMARGEDQQSVTAP
jgi:hypothetical protein